MDMSKVIVYSFITTGVTLDLMRLVFIKFLGYFSFLISLRFALLWFPNINPYMQPFFIIRTLTDFYVFSFESLVPPIFGMDLSLLSSSLFLEWFIKFLGSFTFCDIVYFIMQRIFEFVQFIYPVIYKVLD